MSVVGESIVYGYLIGTQLAHGQGRQDKEEEEGQQNERQSLFNSTGKEALEEGEGEQEGEAGRKRS